MFCSCVRRVSYACCRRCGEWCRKLNARHVVYYIQRKNKKILLIGVLFFKNSCNCKRIFIYNNEMTFFCCLKLNQRCKDFFYSVRAYQMCIKWCGNMHLQTYHNASKSEVNVRVLVVMRLRKSMHTDLKYPYVSTQSDALWHMRRGVEWWLIFQLFCFILWRFIFTEFMYIKRWHVKSGKTKWRK